MLNPIKVLLVDDEPLAIEIMERFLAERPEFEIIGKATDGFEAFKMIQHNTPDLMVLDIQMPRLNGFELLEILDSPPPVLFATAYDQYAIKAFEVKAIDYLLKPFSKERFFQALSRCAQAGPLKNAALPNQFSEKNKGPLQRIVVKHHQQIVIVPVDEILYIEAWDDYVRIHTNTQTFVKKQTLSHFEKVLTSPQFIRIHRSYHVSLKHITAIQPTGDGGEIRLTNGFHLPVSRSGYPRLKAALS